MHALVQYQTLASEGRPRIAAAAAFPGEHEAAEWEFERSSTATEALIWEPRRPWEIDRVAWLKLDANPVVELGPIMSVRDILPVGV